LVREMAIVAMVVLAGAPSLAQGGAEDEGAELLQELTAARVRIDVDGDLVAVQEELTKLEERLRALGSAAPRGARHTLLEAQVAVYLKRNKVADASALLDGAGADPALEALRAQVRAAARQGDGTPNTLRSIVADCIERGDMNRLQMLGPAVAEHVGTLALENPNDLPQRELLGVLLALDERFGVRFLIEHFDAGGVLWKRRILKALQDQSCIADEDTWTRSEPYVLLEPELLTLFARLIAVPETAVGTMKSLELVEERDAFSPELVAAVARGLGSYGTDFAAATMALFEGNAVALSAQPILEAMLGVKDEHLRRLAAEKLLSFERSEVLLAHANDPDPLLRVLVAQAFSYRDGQLVERGKYVDYERSPVIGPREFPVLKTLLSDPDESVRSTAVRGLDHVKTPLPAAEFDALLKDPSAKVRMALAWCTNLPGGTRPAFLARLAADPAPEVVGEVRQVLERAAGMHQNIQVGQSALARDPVPYLPALEVLWQHARSPLSSSYRDWYRDALLASGEGLRAITAWILAARDTETLRTLVARTSPNSWLALSDELLARLLASLPAGSSGGDVDRLWEAVRQAQPPRSAALRLLFADAKAPRTARITAARYAADASDGFREALLAFLRQPTWKSEPVSTQEAEDLGAVGSRLSQADGGVACLAILHDASITRELAQAVLDDYPLDVARSAELTREALARWFKPELPASGAVLRALEHLGSRPDLVQGSVLDDALVHPVYSYQAIRSMAALRNPAYLPKIARGLTAEWAPSGDERQYIQREAAEALASFNDPAAAEYLLLGLRSSDDSVRFHCKTGLDRLEEYETRARAWKDRGLATPTKETALAELLTMLADKDPLLRAQAALGLATLGATETLPQLIRMLKDPDANVRAAAQKALDRLNALEPAPASGDGG
ncbi:MAG: HEAT repeat domain-containing protein, partial [Planctomycetota bacterium]